MEIKQRWDGGWEAIFIKRKTFFRKEKYIILTDSYDELKKQIQIYK